MNPLFVDTGFYVALLSPRDVWHTRAVELSREIHRPVVLTDLIVVELGNACSSVRDRGLFAQLVSRLQADPQVRIVEFTRDLLQRGLALFQSRPDKDWSLTDCVSFVVMDDLGLREVLGADRHFEQAGFTILLK
jgi:predicted nucleic acid-binding protein